MASTQAQSKNDPSITYFPVGNGDSSLIKLSDGTTVLIDLNFTQACDDDDDPSRYDVRGHLLRELRRDSEGRPHLSAFILTHPDQDHVRGVDDIFYLGDPSAYSDKDKKAERIIIDELWFAPRVFNEFHGDLCEDAQHIREEAMRRKKMYRRGEPAADFAGNRIRVVGFSENDDFEGLEAVTTVPGKTINKINGAMKTDFEFFVHAPFKSDTDDEDGERNDTSIVLQARFAVDGEERAALAMFGGDAGCAVWEAIIDRSDDDSLEWDLLLAPHHCSWTFFSELPSEKEEPSEKVLDFLDKHRTGAFVISSSKPIKDDDDNPPHFIAAKKYQEKVGVKKLLCTGEHPNAKKPEPIYFTMSKNGPVKDTFAAASEVQSSAARAATIMTPKTYG